LQRCDYHNTEDVTQMRTYQKQLNFAWIF
jgi:hypothetical protein